MNMYISWPIDRGKIAFDKIISFTGDLEGLREPLESGGYYVVGLRRGLFPRHISQNIRHVEYLISFSNYRGVKRIDRKYMKIYGGTRIIDLLKFYGDYRIYVPINYPPIIYESIGGLIGQGYKPFTWEEGIYLHIIRDGDLKYISYGSQSEHAIIKDVHATKPYRIKGYIPRLTYIDVSLAEGEIIVKRFLTRDIPFSIFRTVGGYKIVSLIFEEKTSRVFRQEILDIIDKSRIRAIALSKINGSNIPSLSYKTVESKKLVLTMSNSPPDSLARIIYFNNPSLITIFMSDAYTEESEGRP